MKKILILILTGILIFSGCSVKLNKQKEDNQPDMTEQSTLTQEGSLETSGNISDTDIPSLEEKGIFIQGEAKIDKFMREEDGTFRFPGGTIKEVSYLLPGYKKVIVDQETYKDSIEKIFEFLEIAGEKPQSIPYATMDGAGLMIKYAHNDQITNVELYSSYNMKTVVVRYSMDDVLYHDSGLILSEELSQIIHQLSGWEIFDIAKLIEIDSMSIQIVSGEAASDLVVTLSGEQARSILDRMSSSAEVTDWGNGGYNILVKMYKGDVLTYNAYLSGDSSPTIGIESQFFKINSDIVREIYKELNHDMPVS